MTTCSAKESRKETYMLRPVTIIDRTHGPTLNIAEATRYLVNAFTRHAELAINESLVRSVAFFQIECTPHQIQHTIRHIQQDMKKAGYHVSSVRYEKILEPSYVDSAVYTVRTVTELS